jgi:DNA-binding transcriptional LysR family regulator
MIAACRLLSALGSFAAAARELHVTHGAVSRMVAGFEHFFMIIEAAVAGMLHRLTALEA